MLRPQIPVWWYLEMGPLEGVWSWGRALVSGVSALIQRTPESSGCFCHVRTQLEDDYLWTRKQALSRQDLGLSGLQTVRNQCVLFKPRSPWYCGYTSLNERKLNPQRGASSSAVLRAKGHQEAWLTKTDHRHLQSRGHMDCAGSFIAC